MDLPSISDINSMKRDNLRGVLINISKKRNNADTPGDSLKNTLHTILCEVKACNEETKALKEEIATLKLSNDALCKELSELKCVSSSASTSASKDSTLPVKFADVVKQSVRSVFHDDKSKNEIIMSKVKEGKNDQQYVTNVCKIIHFEWQPTDVVRLGQDHQENHQRPGTPPNELNCLYLNARSVKSVTNERNKPVELQHILSTFEVHLVAITETWLTEDVLDNKVLSQKLDNLSEVVRRPDLKCECEILVCEISGPSRVNIAIILVYRPPSSDCATFTFLLDETLCKVSAEYSNICLLGDFNMPNIDWHALDIVSSTPDATFIQMTQSHALDQLKEHMTPQSHKMG
ncbi:hypothetical protein CAPTEDRAFT_193561 [Capitella teleta]|uniref:Endonuclease/exonuclease/phosphatase domain-containing protein n=1 Tax=Capitella teleta TaxID=283909 RepID=R7V925_CAPTE|nr:hypothetical protein CAPTEDRAFT_193561 [Capitella teleta]|eukprot:ELU15348.1 hypothetical protein CAPTEDRAFT_193561 [Capitella teleta]